MIEIRISKNYHNIKLFMPWDNNTFHMYLFRKTSILNLSLFSSSVSFNLFQHLGGQGPYEPFPKFDLEITIPDDCKIIQAHMIHRHNERYPTMGAGAEYKTTLDKFTGKNITGP